MIGSVWVGVDPGAKDTGIILRTGRDLAAAHVVSNPDYQQRDPSCVTPGYLATIVRAITDLTGRDDTTRVAVEGVTRPCPHLGVTDPSDIIGAGVVLGAILVRWPDAVVVPPGGNGSHLLRAYPDGLITAGERRNGLDRPAGQSARIRHCRSAWDCALQAPGIARQQAAAGRPR